MKHYTYKIKSSKGYSIYRRGTTSGKTHGSGSSSIANALAHDTVKYFTCKRKSTSSRLTLSGNKKWVLNKGAFDGCSSLKSIEIPSSVTSIGKWAFDNCSSLETVTFKDTSTWYYTSNSDLTGGIQIDVTNPTTNATNLTYTYYWYKK